MSRWRSSFGIVVAIGTSLGALLVVACSSSEEGPPAVDAGDAGARIDGGGPLDSGQDTSDRDVDAMLPPPVYDFAVSCSTNPCVTRIAARGGTHACAVLDDGSVRCWGSNVSGQLGTGGLDAGTDDDAGTTPSFDPKPRIVSGLSNAIGVAATGHALAGTTCVVTGAGDVACFGSDAYGQLGREAAAAEDPNPVPVVIAGLQATSVTLAGSFALALGPDDRLWSWGTNDAFQLARNPGDAAAGPATLPARADRIAGAVRACAGTARNGFVVTETGGVLSWGGSVAEQLGRSSSLLADPVPSPIALTDAASIATGSAHACAVSRTGEAFCWGQNDRGQLGTGTLGDELLPARVLLPDDVQAVAVAAGGDNTCIIAASGHLHCWGANDGGQLGSSPGHDHTSPRRVDGLEQVVSVAIMDESICALLRSGSVVCWGDNLVGQLGRGTRDGKLHVEAAPIVLE